MGAVAIPEAVALYVAPLCPPGHLPLKGGDWLCRSFSPTFNDGRPTAQLPISPLEGEMSGRTEGGAKDRWLSAIGVNDHS